MDDHSEKDLNTSLKDKKNIWKNKKRSRHSDSSSSDTNKKYKRSKSRLKSSKREITKHKHRKKRHSSDSSSLLDSSSSSSDSSSSSSLSEKRQKGAKKKKKLNNKNKELKVEENVDDAPSMDIPLHLMNEGQSMAPMTKEEWEKKQSIVRRVYDESTGRNRLIKGDGEVIEEIVSKDRHNKINREATKGDGDYFQKKMKLT